MQIVHLQSIYILQLTMVKKNTFTYRYFILSFFCFHFSKLFKYVHWSLTTYLHTKANDSDAFKMPEKKKTIFAIRAEESGLLPVFYFIIFFISFL